MCVYRVAGAQAHWTYAKSLGTHPRRTLRPVAAAGRRSQVYPERRHHPRQRQPASGISARRSSRSSSRSARSRSFPSAAAFTWPATASPCRSQASASPNGPVDINIGLLIILGITSIGVYGIALSGWSSNSKYALLGSLRASAQMISYELSLGFRWSACYAHRLPQPAPDRRSPGRVGVALEHSRRWLSVRRLLHLPDGGICGDQPHPFRSAGGGDRIRRRIPHRIFRR